MSSNLAWLAPLFSLAILIVVLAKLGKTSSKLLRQAKRLERQMAAFKSTDHSESEKAVDLRPGNPEDAASKRRAYLKQRTKNKADRQRRLVKRFRTLTSQESENPNV